jgi:integrase
VVRFLEAVPGLRKRAALNLAYPAGLRIAEMASLRLGDIDSDRMLIRVENGKDRYVMPSPNLLGILRACWRLAKPDHRQLALPEVYGVKQNPLPWPQQLLSGVEHANVFEAHATEYSKAATTGQWHGDDAVWAAFDRLQARAETLAN